MGYGPKIAYGFKDNKLVHISSVERGLGCNCICPECKSQLIARKGDIRIKHFAHISGSKCLSANETILHILAKEIIKDSNEINLPSYILEKSYKSVLGTRFEQAYPILNERILNIDKVYLEHDAKRGGFIPDIVIKSNNVNVIVEIFVSHKVDSQKLKKIRKNNEAAIEIQLTEKDALRSRDELRKKIIHDLTNKKWLYDPSQKRAEEHFYKQYRSNRRQQRQAAKQRLNNKHTKPASTYRVAYNRVTYNRVKYDRAIFDFFEKYNRAPTDQEDKHIKKNLRYQRR